MLTKPLSLRQVSLPLTPKQKIILSLLAAVLCTIPLWLGLERAHSAPSGAASPPASPTPSVTIAAPAQVLINTQVKFKVTFTNGNALGYGPFLDVVLDAGGANITKPPHTPPCTCDGITFVSAQMVGVNGGPIPLTTFSALTAPCGSAPNPITHPFASSGVLPVTVPAGGQLITLALPFGSFQPNQPPIEVEITANVSLNADAGHALNISARGGFRFGTFTPVDDPVPDPPVFSDEAPLGTQVVNSQAWIEKKTITPAVMIINKTYLGPEGENATGPNFIGYYPLRYKLTVDVAPGQTITNVVLTDCLPDNMAFHQLVSVTPAGTSTLPPIDIPSPSGCLTVNWSSLTGSAAVVFEFFIPEKDAQGNPVLPADCTPAVSKDNLNITADWIPVDPCDGPLQHLSQGPVVDTLLDKCIAIQKSVAMFTDTGAPGYTPGDTVEYTLNFQISDYKTFSALDITDSLGDGQKLVGPAPTLVVKDQFGTVSGSFVLGSDLISAPYNGNDCGRAIGGTKLTFLVSQKMISLAPPHPRHAAGILTGGFATTTSSATPATGQIVFHTEILDQFAVTQHPGDQFVDKEDPLSNCVVIGGKLMTNVDPPALPASTGVDGHDDSGTTISIVGDTLKKTVYAVRRANSFGVFNPVCGPPGGPGGTSCSNFPNPPQEVRPGDQVTYRLEKTIPSSDAENLFIEDWLPKPTYTVAGINFNNSFCTGTGIPTPGNSCLGPTDTLHSLPVSPTVLPHPTNGITFDYGTTFNDPTNTAGKIDLLFTYQVTNLPFADELFLTNEAQERETNTFGDSFPQVAIAQVNLRQPNLRVHKGTIATSNGFGEFTHQGPQTTNLSLAQAPAGATFSLAGVSGVVNHGDVAAGLMDSNLSNVDANDTVTFAITIENLGGAPAYDVKIEDIIPSSSGIPSCFTIVPGSIVVKRGTGTIVPSLFYSIQPTNPGPSTTSFTITSNPILPIPISAYNATNGANIVTITFRAKLLANIMPGCCDNTVNLLHYSSTLTGPDFVSAGLTPPFTDTANVCVRPKLTKSLITTSEAHTLGSDVTIGEIARYRLVVQLPETGLLTNFKVTDALPAGLKFLNDGTARIAFVSNQATITRTPLLNSPAFTIFGNSLPPSALLNTRPPIPPLVFPGVGGCGSPITFNLGNVKNNDNDPDLEYIVIEFNALVCNVAGNQNGTTLPNTFSVSSNGNLIATSNSLNVLVVEPNLVINKVVSPTTVPQGGTVTYTVTIKNTGAADAFDVNFTDTLPSGLTFVPFSVNVSGSCLPFAGISIGAPWVMCARVPANGVMTITYKAVANPPLPCATCLTTLTNKARVTWTSLPGNGTPVGVNNTTGSITPGASGLVDGERNGVTAPLALNDYAATASAPLTVTGPPCAQAPQSMVAWWPLDETAGTLVTDIAGNIPSNTGTTMPGAINSGGPNSLLAEVNNGFLFCGQPASRFVTVADQLALNFGTAQNFSIDAWIKTSSTSQFQMIVDKLNWPNPNAGYRFYVDNTNRLKFDIGPGAAFTSANPVVLTPGTWYHVAVTVDRTKAFVTFYVNGTPDQAAGTPTTNFNASSPGLNLLLGGTHETQLVPLEGCNYMLDEVEIFNSALAQSEIDLIYHAGCTGKCKCSLATNEKVACDPNGTFNYTFTLTNLSSSTVSNLVFSPVTSNVTITPTSMTIPPLAPGGSTNVTVMIGGPGAVSGAKVCLFVGFVGAGGVVGCRVQHCITLPSCQSSSCATPPPGMVAWWRLDEANGATVVNDIAGFNNQGVPKPGGQVGISGPSSVTGEVLGALFFAGPYVEVPPQAELDFGPGDFSIDAWVKPVDCSHGGGGVLSAIVDKFNGTSGFAFYLNQPTVGVANLYLNINGSTFSSGTIPTLGSATWSHVAVTVAHPPIGPAVGVFYVNGSPVGTFTPPAGSVTNTLPVWIGETRIPGGTCETAIDELELFNRALLPAEIKSIADAKSAGKCPATGSLTVTKIVNNLWAMPFPAGTNFPITVSCLPSGPNVTLNLAAGGTQTLNNIPVGSTCTVTEGALPPPIPHPACPSLEWGTPTYAPGQTVTIPSTGGSQTVTVTNTYFCNTTPGCATPPAGMVAWWPLDETASATSLQDIIGGNNGTPFASPVGAVQAPQPVSGKVGGAMEFPKFGNGLSGARVSPQGTLATIGAADFTIDAWVQVPPAPANRLHYIVNKFDSAQNRGYALYVVSPGVGGNERLEFKWGDGTNVSTVQTISNLTTGQWHHVAVTFARNVGGSALDIRLYVDGAQQGQQTGNPPGLGSLVNVVFLEIGWQPGTIDQPITIDELEIFNSALAQSEIDRIYRAGPAGKCNCLTASNEKITCNPNGTFGYTLTVTNLSSSTVSNLVLSPITSNVTITPASMTIPPLAPGGSTNVTVTVGGPGAVSGAKVCFSVGFVGAGGVIGCRVQHCITLPTCPATCPFIVGHAPDSSTIPTFDIATGTTTAQFVTGASDSRGRGVEVVGGLACWNTTVVYYTSISGDIHVAPYAGGSGGPDITVLPNPRQGGNGIQDLDYANGILYAMTGYNQGNGAVPIVYSLNPCTGAILSSVNLVSSSRNSDGFTVLPTGDFLINDGDGSKTYRAYSSINGAPTGLVITLSASNATGVDYNPSDNSLYFFANFGGSRKLARTDLSGNPLGTVPVNWTGSFNEDISVLCGALPSPTGSLTVTKTVKNSWAMPFPAGTNFPITVSCLPSGPNVTLNLAAGGTQTVNNIPVGSTCTVTEGALPPPLPHPACPSLEWGTPTYAPGQTVTIPSTGGSQTVTVTNTYFCNTTPGCATPPAGMVAWWPLDETSGNVVHSIVGNHDGTTLPGPIGTGSLLVATAPKVGSALFFGQARAEVPDDPALNFGTGDFSIDAWVRSNQSTLLSSIVDKLDTSTTTHRGYAFFVRSGMVQLRIGDGVNTATYQSSNTFVADGTWRHVAVTIRRAGGSPVGQFYIDGVPAGGPFTPLAINLDNSAKLLIGSFRLGNDACSCEVSLDEIELFNTALRPDAIKSIFQADKKGKCKATISGSKFNDLNGNGVRNTGEPGLANWTIRVTDSSGNTQTTTTDSAGNYSLTVAPGTYAVAEILQAGWTQTAPTSGTYAVTVSGPQVVNNRDFGNKKQCAAITLNPAALPAAGINTPYSQTFTATGGCASSFTYSVTRGALPIGLTLGANGVLSGTATQSGDFTFTVTTTDTCGCSQSRTYTLTVNVRPGGFTFTPGMDEFCIWGGGAFYSPTPIDNPNSGVFVNPQNLTGNTGRARLGAIGLCYGRILLANDKVAFKYTFNAIPVAGLSYTDVNPVFIDRPGQFPVSATRRNVLGGGLSPIGFQLYFRPQSRVKPFVDTSGGFLFFKDQVPRLNGARFNFTYDFGGGVQVFRDSRRAFTFGYKYQHLSNGGRALNNPGFDGHVLYFGYSIFKAKKIALGT